MEYVKPEVRVLADAVDAVKTVLKGSHPVDNPPTAIGGPAYEADE